MKNKDPMLRIAEALESIAEPREIPELTTEELNEKKRFELIREMRHNDSETSRLLNFPEELYEFAYGLRTEDNLIDTKLLIKKVKSMLKIISLYPPELKHSLADGIKIIEKLKNEKLLIEKINQYINFRLLKETKANRRFVDHLEIESERKRLLEKAKMEEIQRQEEIKKIKRNIYSFKKEGQSITGIYKGYEDVCFTHLIVDGIKQYRFLGTPNLDVLLTGLEGKNIKIIYVGKEKGLYHDTGRGMFEVYDKNIK